MAYIGFALLGEGVVFIFLEQGERTTVRNSLPFFKAMTQVEIKVNVKGHGWGSKITFQHLSFYLLENTWLVVENLLYTWFYFTGRTNRNGFRRRDY